MIVQMYCVTSENFSQLKLVCSKKPKQQKTEYYFHLWIKCGKT